MKIKNIQTRLLIMFLPLMIVVLAVLSGISYYVSQQALTKSVDETARAVGTDYANRVQDDVEFMLGHLADLTQMPVLQAGTDKGQIAAVLTNDQKRQSMFDVMVYIGPDGQGVASNGAAASYQDRDYFKKVIETKKAVVSDPLVSKATGKLAVVLAVPVVQEEKLTGVLVGTFSTERLTARIKDLKFLESGYGQVADDSGIIIAHPKRTDLTGKLNLRDKKINPELKLDKPELDDKLIRIFTEAADHGKQYRDVYTFVDGVERVALSTPIDLPGGQRWVMTVAAPEKEALQATYLLARTMLFVSLLALALATGTIVFLAKRFTRPIAIIRDECLLLAAGDLREREAKVSSDDEIGQLAQGFREMRTHLHGLVVKVHSQAEQLAASSEELTASADQSAQVATQIAESITEVAAGASEQLGAANDTTRVVEQMSASIQQVAATTNQVAAQSTQAVERATDGNASVRQAVQQMGQIEQTVNASAQVVAALGERSKQIDQIVTTISGIAGQTNLLALNAAIEAARAGEQGRGFAVVAEEVRKLAEQSQAATEQIARLIADIQGDTDKAVVSMTQGTREVKHGAAVVQAAGAAFGEIVELINQVSDQIKEIAAAIDQVATGSQQIVGAVQRIDHLSKNAAGEAETVSAATEEQSAAMEEIASSSQALAHMAAELQEAVGKFNV